MRFSIYLIFVWTILSSLSQADETADLTEFRAHVWSDKLTEGNLLEDLRVHETIILKWILQRGSIAT